MYKFFKVSNEVAILIPFIFAVERTLFYISKAWFYREFFSKGSFQVESFNHWKDSLEDSITDALFKSAFDDRFW